MYVLVLISLEEKEIRHGWLIYSNKSKVKTSQKSKTVQQICLLRQIFPVRLIQQWAQVITRHKWQQTHLIQLKSNKTKLFQTNNSRILQ